MEWLLTTEAPAFPVTKYPNVFALTMSAIGHFNRTALKSSVENIGTGAKFRPLEAIYQDELYRSCFSLLGHIYLISEWSDKKKNGRIDFYVRSVKWGIECVRDGAKLQEHIGRFAKGGRYYPWIDSGQMKAFILLDFRRSIPRTPQGMLRLFLYLSPDGANIKSSYTHSLAIPYYF